MDIKFLEELSNADALAGEEDEVRNLLVREMRPNSNNIFCDNLGSVIFQKNGNSEGPKIMIAAHMDEVGFKVRSICPGGQVIVRRVGGVKQLAKFMQKVRITTKDAKKYKAYLQSSYTEDKSHTEIPGETYLDLGLQSALEVKNLGISVGDIVCYDSNFEHLSNKDLIMGKALDNRIGCYIMAKVLENLQGKSHDSTIYFAGTTSEEIGVVGAKTASAKINPDIAIVIDTCSFGNQFDTSNRNCRQIGQGMLINYADKRMQSNRKFIDVILESSNKLNKKIQHDMFDRGGTDAGIIQLNGCGLPAVACCVALRYGHCSNSIANMNDINDTIEIITDFLINFNSTKMNKCLNFL